MSKTRSYKERPPAMSTGGDGQEGEAAAPALGSMAEIFKLMKEMEEQRLRATMEERARQQEELKRRERMVREELARRELVAEEERRRQAEQHAESMRLMQEQVEALRGMVARERPTGESVQLATGRDSVKLARLNDGDDIEAYLTTFERIMQAEGVGQATWALRLAPQLTGKAQQAYAAMRNTDSCDYPKVKRSHPEAVCN